MNKQRKLAFDIPTLKCYKSLRLGMVSVSEKI